MLVASFYCFARLAREELGPMRRRLQALGGQAGLLGTVLLAEEGINGALCGSAADLERILQLLRADPRLADLAIRRSTAAEPPFFRLRVRLRREIVTMGIPGVDPLAGVGRYVPPGQWNALIQDPSTLVVDTRNSYEVELGTFTHAINPGTRSFREFPAWVERELPVWIAERQPRRLALFCTGGIRCEKATAHLLQQGYGEVHHLQGGILGYLEATAEEDSLWEGECFVFDQRAALNHHLTAGHHVLCHGCRMPLSPEDQTLPSYIEGVSCRHCAAALSQHDRERFQERQRQVLLARGRGEVHIGRVFEARTDTP